MILMTLLSAGLYSTSNVKALNAAALGIYKEPKFQYSAFESWLGRPVAYGLTFVSRSSWNEVNGNSQSAELTIAQNWVAGSPSTRRVIWSTPMVPESGSSQADIAACGNGTHNAQYVTLANHLISRGLHRSVIRLAWEMNGSWFPGGYVGTTATSRNNWMNCWRQVVNTMRGVSGQQFTFSFNPNIGYSEAGTFFGNYYPGDAYVDVISLDVYDFHYGVCGSSFTARWNNILNQPGGLNDFKNFAVAHNKPMAFDEWGLWGTGAPHCGGGDDPQYIDAMADFFENNNVVWHTYFDVLSAGDHRLDVYPNSKARYKARFGTTPPTNTPSGPTATRTNTPIPGSGTVYEAETGTFGGGAIVQSATNASGGQVIGNMNNVASFSQVGSVNGGTGGSATLVIRFANGYTTTRSLSLYVNGVDVQQITFPVTGSWNTFQDLTTTVNLNSGTGNTIKLQRDSADVAAADIDKYTVTISGGGGPTNTPTRTPTPTATNTPPPGGTYNDEFNSTSLAGIWSWVRQDSANWSLSAVPGSMRITCQAGEINNANTTAKNILIETAPSGDWTAIAKVTGKPTANWAQVALLAYQDDNNWVKADRVYDSGNKFQVGREAAGAYTFTNVTDSIASTTSYLRLVKSGTSYTASYSADGSSFTQIGAAQTITLSNIKIGLSCYGGTGISGAFDWIHVTQP